MKSNKFILLIFAFLIILNIANAETMFDFNMGNLSSSQKIQSIFQTGKTTALVNVIDNVTQIGCNWVSQFNNQSAIPNMWVQTGTPTISTTTPFITGGNKMYFDGTDEAKYADAGAEGIVCVAKQQLSGGNFYTEYDASGACTTEFFGWAKEATNNRGAKTGNCANFNTAFPAVNTSEWLYTCIDAARGKTVLTNGSDISYFEHTAGINYGQLNFQLSGGTDGAVGYSRECLAASAQNTSENRVEIYFNWDTPTQFVNLSTEGMFGDGNFSIIISPNNGTTWFTANLTTNATRVDLLQLSQHFLFGHNTSMRTNISRVIIRNISDVAAVPDTTPQEILELNMTSEATPCVVNLTDSHCFINTNNACKVCRTNDTTTTLRMRLSESGNCTVTDLNRNLNYSDIVRGGQSIGEDTSDDFNCVVTLNDNNASRIGIQNFSISATDDAGNQNISATYFFSVNITDGTPPNATIFGPINTTVWGRDTNYTLPLQVNFTVYDNYDSTITNVSVLIDGVLYFNKTNYANGTRFIANISGYNTTGDHNLTVNATDSFNNVNGSSVIQFSIIQVPQPVTITLYLNETHANKSYEFNTLLLDKDYGIGINITTDPQANWSLDFDYMQNWTRGFGNTFLRLNLTELNITKTANGSFTVNLTPHNSVIFRVDNNTDLVKAVFKLKGYLLDGNYPCNLSIDINKDTISDIIVPGCIKENKLDVQEFIFNSEANKRATNLTYTTAGSKLIFVNVTSLLSIKNFTMSISGYDIDIDNVFNYTEKFNATSAIVNYSLTYKSDAPLGIYDNFVAQTGSYAASNEHINDTKWNVTTVGDVNINPVMDYTTDNGVKILRYRNRGSTDTAFVYANTINSMMDLRNSSYVSFYFNLENSCSGGAEGSSAVITKFQSWDNYSTTPINVFTIAEEHCSSSGTTVVNINFWNVTLTSGDSNNWNAYRNGTLMSTFTLDALNNSNRISPRIEMSAQKSGSNFATQNLFLYKVELSGAWLNYSTTNGTYTASGNFTSGVIQTTATDLQRILMTPSSYNTQNTSIIYYVSNVCNQFNPPFELATLAPDIHVFGTSGTSICWRATLNSTENITSPIVRKVKFEVITGTTKNISVDAGNDGTIDWKWEFGLNETTSPKIVNTSIIPLNNYSFVNCRTTKTCLIPISIRAFNPGTVGIDYINVTQAIVNEEIFNLTNLTGEVSIRNLSILENLTIWNITTNQTGGLLNLYDFDIEFRGSKNITLFVHSIENSTSLLGISNLTLSVYYSNFTHKFPRGSFYNVFASSKDDKNLTPSGQNSLTPIWNLTSRAYDDGIDIYVKYNETNACTNVTYSNTSTKSDGNVINSTGYRGILFNVTHWEHINHRINQTVNITMNSTFNYTNLSRKIVDEQFSVVNASAPYPILNRNSDYRINFTSGNFTLLNSTYNITNLYATYNFTTSAPWKGIWNWWDLSNCTRRFLIPSPEFRGYCQHCVR